MRVLVVKMSALGDIIHALPVLDYLHRAHPGIQVDWVAESPFRDVLEGNPLISQLHLVSTKVWRKRPLASETWRAVGSLKRELRARSYDLVFDIQGNLKSGLIASLAGCGTVVGFAASELQERINLLFTTKRVTLLPQDRHITDQYLRLVSSCFGRDFSAMRLTSDIATSPADASLAESLLASLPPGRKFLFHQGTTWDTKYWLKANWIELGRQLLASFQGASVLLSWGNEGEKEVAGAIASAIGPGARVIDRYPLKGFAALLKRMDVVVGGDTGPVHIAAAVGTPTVSLYRASDGRRSGPRGDRHVIIQAPLHCTACFRTKCQRDHECRASITVSSVMKGIESIFKDSRGGEHG